MGARLAARQRGGEDGAGSPTRHSRLENATLHTRAVANYRSINSLIVPLGRLNVIMLEKLLGQTAIVGQGMLDEPAWHWPD